MMIKKIVFLCFLALNVSTAAAQERVTYIEEVKALGSVAGQGLVCNASKYDDFEMLARAILLTKAPSDSALQRGVRAYNEAKANAYISKRMDGGYLCGEIRERFNNQDIFQATLYEDGTIQMPNGQLLTPRRPYDASQIYRKDVNEQKRLKAIYDGGARKKAVIKSTTDELSKALMSKGSARQAKKNAGRRGSQSQNAENLIGHLRRSR